MKITKIYLDMDGVIADFETEYKNMFGELPEETRVKKGMPEFVVRWNQIISTGIFRRLQKMPDAEILLEHLKTVSSPVYILSSTSDIESHGPVQEQKLEWLKNENILYPAVLVPGKRFKQHYATKHSLLIDDTEVNVTQWLDNGGQGIVHTSASETIKEMSKYEFRSK